LANVWGVLTKWHGECFSSNWHLANVGKFGESSQNSLVNVGKSSESRKMVWQMSASLASPRKMAWRMSASLVSLAYFQKMPFWQMQVLAKSAEILASTRTCKICVRIANA
jgi:hypothetical protein